MGMLDLFRRKLTPDRFANLLIERIKAAGDDRPVTYDAENFCLVSTERGAITNLHNLYTEHQRADKEDREKVVRSFLAAWFTTEMPLPETIEDARHDLLLSIRSRSYYEAGVPLMSDSLEPNDQLQYVEVGGCLAVSPIYDLPTSIRSLSADDLEQWDVTLYEALEIARQNLRESTSEVAQAGELYIFSSGDSHDAARLVLTDLIADLEVDGDPIAMAPNREMLLVTGSENEEALQHMAEIAGQAFRSERGISGIALQLVSDEWRPWLPESDHPAYNDFARLRAESLSAEYAQQKLLLDKRNERDGVDLYVASYNATQQQETGEVASFCVWGEGLETLLPEVDRVILMTASGDADPNSPVPTARPVAAGDWETIRRHAGHLMEPTGDYPARFKVSSFPTPEQLTRIGMADWASE